MPIIFKFLIACYVICMVGDWVCTRKVFVDWLESRRK